MSDITQKAIDLVLLTGNKGKLQDFISSVKHDDLDNLSEVLAQADGRTVDSLNWVAADLKIPLVMLATTKSSAGKHQLSFEQTISVLDSLIRLEASRSLDKTVAEDCAAWLIQGLQTKQGLNLMTQLSTVYKNGVVAQGSVLQQSDKVDKALEQHFRDTIHRPLLRSEFLRMCDWLTKASMGRTLTAILSHLRENNQFDEIRQIFAESFSRSQMDTIQLEAFTNALGPEMLLTICQERMLTDTHYRSLGLIRDTFGEEALLSDDFVSKIVNGLKQLMPIMPSFITEICRGDVDLEDWPKTATLMIENHSRIASMKGASPHRYIDQFAANNGLLEKLISQRIDVLRCEFISLDEWNHTAMRAKSHAEIFSLGVAQSKGNQRRELRLKELLQACKGADLVQLKDLLGGISGDAVMAISEVSGGLTNQKEVMRHYPQAKALFLERDLGL